MKHTKEKKKSKTRLEDQEVDRRKFIEKSARDVGACGFAIYELAKTIKDEIIQGIVDDIKEVIRRP
jgi:hypothetical protein